ncbi:NAC domain-containing protein [Vigna angularis]|uniref:NAC domain-containing protein n=3 Tax=Phaseolus angularis TaxID=3914 RepID=A0A8T0KS08_PHAAN|nr:NAC domain-containing protein 78 isoform X1 [Vigna angularis]KAG2401912.1 NAC domain-containing protein [Vigna angularis]BAT94607.1 hypothetical protein VIGAN_08122500 [Vigna angularis var. angularis]
MAPMGPGFRFHPTDEELVVFYLKRKITGNLSRYDHIAVVDVYKLEPWDLPPLSKLKTKDLEWYFFSVLDRKYGNGSRTNRATEKGYWKTTGKDRPVAHGDRTVGMKKTLVYHIGRAPHGRRTNWVMHEYKMLDEELTRAGTVLDVYVVCRIFEKSGAGPKNGAKYGAPLDEKEWDVDEENEQKEVVALPATAHRVVVPLTEIRPNVVAPPLPATAAVAPPVVATGGDFCDGIGVALPSVATGADFWDDIGAFLETNDLDGELDLSDMIGGVTFPSLNFHHGECSTYAENSQELIKDQEPLADTFGISGPENGQTLDMAEQHDMGTGSVKDEDMGEQSEIVNLLNFNDASDNMDLDLYFDAAQNLPTADDESFLETNDLAIGNEDDLIEADPSANDIMLDKYLPLPDDDDGDIWKYISFDYSQVAESENSNSNQGSPLTQQTVGGETANKAVVGKHDSEAQTSNEAFLVQNTEEAKLAAPGNTNPFVKQAYGWLANIPASPAHAFEFPAKDITLGIDGAAQSSHPAHITTGMISITDITFRGNAMDWPMGKIGGFNTAMSTEFSQPDVNCAALIPVSGKTAFVLSHGWIFLTGFSVLILSLSFKIGSIMYTGK